MGLLRGILCVLYLTTVSGELFGDTSAYSSSNTTTHLEDVYIPLDESTRTSSLAANEYQVTNLSLAELPPAYHALVNDRKRSWSDDAFSVAGKDVAATGLAAVGIEHSILTTRLWYIKDKFAPHQSASWKRTQTTTIFDNLVSYVFFYGLSNPKATCKGGKGEWAHRHAATAIGSGATSDAQDDSNAKQHLGKKEATVHRSLIKIWYRDDLQRHDPLRKRAPDRCGSEDGRNIFNYPIDVPNTPTGATIKVTCKAYYDFGYCDQLDVAKKYISEMIRRGKTEGTFTVYNRHNREAHMRCSVAARPYFFNTNECPFEIPGDQDGKDCVGCPKF